LNAKSRSYRKIKSEKLNFHTPLNLRSCQFAQLLSVGYWNYNSKDSMIEGLTTGRAKRFFSPLQNLQTTSEAHSGSYSMHAGGKVTLCEPVHAPPASTKVRNGGVTPLFRLHAMRHASGADNF